MGHHVTSPDVFFSHRPEIRLRYENKDDEVVEMVLETERGLIKEGERINSFLRKLSDKERNLHLERPEEVVRMDGFLHLFAEKAKIFCHGKVR